MGDPAQTAGTVTVKREIWCTLGPSSLSDEVICRLGALGVSLFRLNLSHTTEAGLPRILGYLRSRTRVPVCLDTEGAQVRTGRLVAGRIALPTHSAFSIPGSTVPGDATAFNLYPDYVLRSLCVGDLLQIDSEVLAQVIDVREDRAVLGVLNGGEVGQNKAVTILGREIAMPPLTEKDRRSLELANRFGIRHVALSFVHRAADVDEIRAAVSHEETVVISKIECASGLTNLPDIAAASDAVLIDRGDLSREVNIEKIPVLQKDIIRYCKGQGVKVYVATNLMESMVTAPSPTRAEVNDVFNTLNDGADGLVLAGETAIGAFPVPAANMVSRIIREYEESFSWPRVRRSFDPESHLIEPHGGRLVRRELASEDREGLAGLKTLPVTLADLLDCAHMADGTYSPLGGFMSSDELESVLNTNRLPSGLPWTMPIVLQASTESLRDVSVGERVALADTAGAIRATLDVGEIYSFDADEIAEKWFGTTSLRHPGVLRLAQGGDRFVAGEITLTEGGRPEYHRYDLTPTQTRRVFTQKGWNRVVGFHTRTVPGQYVQLGALESVAADGLYISVTRVRPGDRDNERPVAIGQRAFGEGTVDPPGKVVLGGLSLYPRHCGARESVFAALCHKNMGCSYFILGRASGGMNGASDDDQTRRLFEDLDDMGVVPIFTVSNGRSSHNGAHPSAWVCEAENVK